LGPFKLLRWVRGERLEFVRNPFYWRGPAASDRIDVAIVPNAQTRLVLLRSGAVDLIEVTGVGLDVARTIPGVQVVSRTTNVVDYLQFNLHVAPLNDVRVRRAIAQAINRQKLATAVYHGTLEVSDSVQFEQRYRPTERIPMYDPARARHILDVKRFAIDLAIAAQWRNSTNAAISIAADLAAVGIAARIHPYSEAQFWGPKDQGGILESARYGAALTSWSPALDPDRSYLFGCEAIPPSGGNSMFFCNRRYDSYELAGASFYEPAKREPYYHSAGVILQTDLPVVPLGFERRSSAISRGFHGFRPSPLGRDLWNSWESWRK
jgi:ABC-type transport system substrate-binding protein